VVIRLMRKSRDARDALVILVIVAAGMYIQHHPEKIDGFLNWVLRRNYLSKTLVHSAPGALP
jgi:hypothetical protein